MVENKVIDLNKKVYFFDERENVQDMLVMSKVYFQNDEICMGLVEWVLNNNLKQNYTISFSLDTGAVIDEGFECWRATNDSKWVKEELSEIQEKTDPLKNIDASEEVDLLESYSKELGLEYVLTLKELVESHRHLRKHHIQMVAQYQKEVSSGSIVSCDDLAGREVIKISKLKSMSVEKLVEFLHDYI